jgi:DegV family protein with EDD domain
MKYVIISDTTCDLTPDECATYGIWPQLFAQNITCNNEDIPLDDPETFYHHLENGDYPPGQLKTSSGGYDSAMQVLNDVVEYTKDDTVVVYAGVSPHMSSGTIAMMQLALESYAKMYPYRKFIYIDTKCVSNGQATFLQYLAKYDGDDIEAFADKLGKHIVHLFTQSDLSYSAKSGRYNIVKRIAMMALSKLKLSPWMYFPSDGKLDMQGKLRHGDTILREWVNYYIEHAADDNEFIRIGYGGSVSQRRAEKFAQMLEERAGVTRDKIQMAYVSPVVGAHTGDTVLSFFFKQRDER